MRQWGPRLRVRGIRTIWCKLAGIDRHSLPLVAPVPLCLLRRTRIRIKIKIIYKIWFLGKLLATILVSRRRESKFWTGKEIHVITKARFISTRSQKREWMTKSWKKWRPRPNTLPKSTACNARTLLSTSPTISNSNHRKRYPSRTRNSWWFLTRNTAL